MQTADNIIIIGAGFTGLGATLASGFPVFEAADFPGGICASYSREGFRFEIGGGHWIFGGDPLVLQLFERVVPLRFYTRRSAVFFAGKLPATAHLAGKFVDYPLQNHLYQLGAQEAQKALQTLVGAYANGKVPRTMAEWLEKNFGTYLCEIFFFPFHERYTAGLFRQIAPQDPYKTPLNLGDVVAGSFGNSRAAVGYNVRFAYPVAGLNTLAQKLAALGKVQYGKQVVAIDPENRCITFADGSDREYEVLLSTIPLNHLLRMAGYSSPAEVVYTSVLVLNLGVELPSTERAQHGYHWLYVPDSSTGFHRIGYYSNVDVHFLPERWRNPRKYAALYVEFAFRGGEKPDAMVIQQYIAQTVEELRELGLIHRVLIADPTWIDVAYTWQKPGAQWVAEAIRQLQQQGIFPIGRYGRWTFQGIAESFREGLSIGAQAAGLSRVAREVAGER